jgi:hypothetical protein
MAVPVAVRGLSGLTPALIVDPVDGNAVSAGRRRTLLCR